MKKTVSTALALAIVLSSFLPFAFGGRAASVGGITGETSRTVEALTLSDGTRTGVELTTVNFTGYYGTNKVLHAAECDLSNTHLSVDVFNCGTYLVSKKKVAAAAADLSQNGKTVLAAVNGDLWMISSYGNASATLAVSRGAMLIDREIWATQEIESEAGIGGVKDAFGITSQNQPIVGSPEFSIQLSDSARGISVSADGLNRLPADNSVIIYNNRVNSSNYALTDSYEIELESASPAFTLSGTVTAKVKAIYESGSTSRPSIGANTILITARGTRISEVSGLRVGDTVTFTASVYDHYNNTDLWYDAVDVISGHKMVLCEGADISPDTSTSEYPTAFIGINDSGKVLLATVSASKNGVYKGLRFSQAKQFCREMGYNSVFYLDGGGSTTMVTLKDGAYSVRNCTSDGSPRSVINGVAITWNTAPVCEQQGSLNYIRKQTSLPQESGAFIDGALLCDVTSYKNHVSLRPHSVSVAEVKTAKATNDPFFAIDYSGFAPADASEYKAVVVKFKPDGRMTGTSNLGLFYACGNDTGFSSARYVSKAFENNGEWQYAVFQTVGLSGWSGNINSLRIDLYDSETVPYGYTAEIGFVALCRSFAEMKSVCSDIPPADSIGYYLCYLHDKNSTHTVVSGEALDAACTESGHTASTYCSGCGKVFTEEKEIAPLGHDFVNGVCSRCQERDTVTYTVTVDGETKTYSAGDTVTVAQNESYKLIDLAAYRFAGWTGDTEVLSDSSLTETSFVMPERDIILTSSYMLIGDANGDGRVNAADANLVKRMIIGELSSVGMMDINLDGRINAADANCIKRMLAGIYIPPA